MTVGPKLIQMVGRGRTGLILVRRCARNSRRSKVRFRRPPLLRKGGPPSNPRLLKGRFRLVKTLLVKRLNVLNMRFRVILRWRMVMVRALLGPQKIGPLYRKLPKVS